MSIPSLRCVCTIQLPCWCGTYGERPNYEVTYENEAKRRNSGAKTKTFEENHFLLLYAVSSNEDTAYQRQLSIRNIIRFPETVPFPRRLHNYCCDDLKEASGVNVLDAYDNNLPQKEKDPRSFTLSCLINNICFNKDLVDLGASVSVMPFSTYTNLGLEDLSHTRMTIELADRTIKQPKGIAVNVLVRIGKFVFPIDFVVLDIPEDDDVPLILGRPFLSTAHVKIDVYKRKVTLRAGEEKL
ncbi:hypothetical protein Tco_1285802, partial [Tanacetum coccineum]